MLSNAPVVFAANVDGGSETGNTALFSTQELEAYVAEMKAQFLNVVDLGEDVAPGAQAAYSQGYEILSDDDPYNRIYFLFLDGKCRGVLVVTYANGEFASSFTPSRLPTISDALLSGEPFTLHTYGESLIYCGEDRAIGLNGPLYDVQLTANVSLLHGTDELAQVIRMDTETYQVECPTFGTDAYGSTLTASYGLLEVPFVENGKSPADGSGLCWAATVASIAAYRKNTTPLSATDIYYAVQNRYGGIPGGTVIDAGRAFYCCGLDYTSSLTGKLFDTVKRIIQRDRPIYAGLSRTGGGHVVVICGYQTAAGGYHYYTLMDCNNQNHSYTTVSVSSSSTNFTYVAWGYTYTVWDEALY